MGEAPDTSKSTRSFLVGAAIGALAVGMVIHSRVRQPKPEAAPEAIDIEGLPEEEVPAVPPVSPKREEPLPEPPALSAEQERPWLKLAGRVMGRGTPAQTLSEQIRKNERRYVSLAVKYTNKHPSMREYGREWMQSKSLRKLKSDYARDRDPVKFAFGAASSPDFHRLATKYASRPEFRQFVMDAMAATPMELMHAIGGYLQNDRSADKLFARYASVAGLPPDIFKK